MLTIPSPQLQPPLTSPNPVVVLDRLHAFKAEHKGKQINAWNYERNRQSTCGLRFYRDEQEHIDSQRAQAAFSLWRGLPVRPFSRDPDATDEGNVGPYIVRSTRIFRGRLILRDPDRQPPHWDRVFVLVWAQPPCYEIAGWYTPSLHGWKDSLDDPDDSWREAYRVGGSNIFVPNGYIHDIHDIPLLGDGEMIYSGGAVTLN